ncbi:hypothetical protein ES703_43441 [subsurface metagenome]
MARIKFGSIVTQGSGSLGGHTFQNSSGGAQLRSKPINNKQPSAAQSLIRSYNPHLQHGWRDLSNTQRDIWSRFAVSHGIGMRNESERPLSGHSLWMKYNFNYISLDLPLITSPFSNTSPYLGPELVDQSLYNDPGLPWWYDFSAGWSGNGEAILSELPGGSIRRSNFWTNNTSYLVSVTVILSSGSFNLPYDGYIVALRAFSSGSYKYYFPSTTHPHLYMYSYDFIGSITSLSIKQLFNY